MSKQLEWLYSHGDVGLPDIRKVEEQLGIRFPSKYVEIILKYHPIRVSPDVLYLPGEEILCYPTLLRLILKLNMAFIFCIFMSISKID
ncbi:SMI1/KNR4 family protein [Thermoactinomyces mirandus]|uniref:SMI1/KNR4 family protein n=1 Tax=Thermoactinomyces mirandus TaxID=2756294 RepID=UPI001C68F2EE